MERDSPAVLPDAEVVRRALYRRGVDHLVLTPLPAPRARVWFAGSFAGSEVIWDAVFIALGAEPRAAARPFIEVGPGDGGVFALCAGLALERMDAPAVAKAVIMVRNYRRLRRGRHEFGAHHGRDA